MIKLSQVSYKQDKFACKHGIQNASYKTGENTGEEGTYYFHYQEAKSYEMLGDYDQAMQIYKKVAIIGIEQKKFSAYWFKAISDLLKYSEIFQNNTYLTEFFDVTHECNIEDKAVAELQNALKKYNSFFIDKNYRDLLCTNAAVNIIKEFILLYTNSTNKWVGKLPTSSATFFPDMLITHIYASALLTSFIKIGVPLEDTFDDLIENIDPHGIMALPILMLQADKHGCTGFTKYIQDIEAQYQNMFDTMDYELAKLISLIYARVVDEYTFYTFDKLIGMLDVIHDDRPTKITIPLAKMAILITRHFLNDTNPLSHVEQIEKYLNYAKVFKANADDVTYYQQKLNKLTKKDTEESKDEKEDHISDEDQTDNVDVISTKDEEENDIANEAYQAFIDIQGNRLENAETASQNHTLNFKIKDELFSWNPNNSLESTAYRIYDNPPTYAAISTRIHSAKLYKYTEALEHNGAYRGYNGVKIDQFGRYYKIKIKGDERIYANKIYKISEENTQFVLFDHIGNHNEIKRLDHPMSLINLQYNESENCYFLGEINDDISNI